MQHWLKSLMQMRYLRSSFSLFPTPIFFPVKFDPSSVTIPIKFCCKSSSKRILPFINLYIVSGAGTNMSTNLKLSFPISSIAFDPNLCSKQENLLKRVLTQVFTIKSTNDLYKTIFLNKIFLFNFA